MRLSLFLGFTAALARPGTARTSAAPAGASPQQHDKRAGCVEPQQAPAINGSDLCNFGVVLFPGFDMIDVFGTLEPLQLMANTVQQMTLSLIAEKLDPVTTASNGPMSKAKNSTFWPAALPNNTFGDDLDLDVLIVPGGPGVRNPDLPAVTDYIARMFPKVKIFITICTGSGLAARAGVLDGVMATTNKNAWETILPMGPRVKWVSPARYVVDGYMDLVGRHLVSRPRHALHQDLLGSRDGAAHFQHHRARAPAVERGSLFQALQHQAHRGAALCSQDGLRTWLDLVPKPSHRQLTWLVEEERRL
ncbi:DJ-1/PfpI family protein [Ophiocordyceps sinensis CO18]|uniref:DJ-1/PfpI family protein n=1 Tax=Ophiocordyceps sinensis (strain Co18 / CGMCC 3.14243) TaxID=911162 RepID=T5AP22_OPHSC|nr:DJ-1/PfpI family protein [Ophiocordyceps sinensis CO18]